MSSITVAEQVTTGKRFQIRNFKKTAGKWLLSVFKAEEKILTRADVERVVAKHHNCGCRGRCLTCGHIVDDVWPA